MANAMMSGIIKAGLSRPEDIIGGDPSGESRKKTSEARGVRVTADNLTVLEESAIIFLAVKPQYYPQMIEEIRDHVREDHIFISIGAGKTLSFLDEHFAKPVKIIRIMPNTPAQVGEGMTAVCPNALVSVEETEQIMEMIRTFGKAEILPEHLFDIVTGVSGSGPAYVFMFIEAMADAAVEGGMPRDKAYTFAAQTVLGSARMLLETGKHPGELKDMVTSPAGTTIAGVHALEEKGLRAAVMEGVARATTRSKEL